MQQGTALPPAPPAPKTTWPKVVAAVVITIVALAIIGNATKEEPSGLPQSVIDSTREEIDSTIGEEPATTDSDEFQIGVARVAWDTAVSQADRDAICDYYNTPPVGTTPELVRVFAEGAELSYADADRVLDQLLAEKC